MGVALTLAGLAALLGCLLAAHVGTTALVGPSVARGPRAVVALGVFVSVQAMLGQVLVWLDLFRAVWVGALLAGIAVATVLALRVVWLRELVAADLRSMVELPAELRGSGWGLAGLTAVLVVPRVVRDAIAPMLGWDFLTYHGPRIAFWAQSGGLSGEYAAPGAWQYYTAYPPAGELLFAWTALFGGSDATVAVIGAAVMGGLFVATAVFAAELGAPPLAWGLAGLAVALAPSVTAHLGSGYIDSPVALPLVCGMVGLVIADRSRDPTLAALSFLAIAGGMTMKPTALPVFAAGGLALLVHARSMRLLPAAIVAVAIAGALVWPLHEVLEHGNPVYPNPIRALGLQGHPELAQLWVDAGHPPFVDSLGMLFLAPLGGRFGAHNGFGLGGILLVGIGTAAAVANGRRAPRLLTLFALVSVLGLGLMVNGFGTYAYDNGRYGVALLAPLAVSMAFSPWGRVLLTLVFAGHAFYLLPWWRIGAFEWQPLSLALGVGTVLAGGTWVALRKRRSALAGTVTVGLLGALVAALVVRHGWRSTYYAQAVDRSMVPCVPIYHCSGSDAFPLWTRLDDGAPHTLAVTAGFDCRGHNWFVYPLFGSRLQNRLIHVRALDGSYDYRQLEQLAKPGDREAWLDRLRASDADYLVLLPPLPLESQWAQGVPWLRPVPTAADGVARLFAIERQTGPR